MKLAAPHDVARSLVVLQIQSILGNKQTEPKASFHTNMPSININLRSKIINFERVLLETSETRRFPKNGKSGWFFVNRFLESYYFN